MINKISGMGRKLKKLYACAVVYLYLPIFLFLFGWTKLWISIPIAMISSVGIYFGMQKIDYDTSKEFVIKKVDILLFFVLFMLLCIFCGGGDLFPQDYDWSKHHAIIRDLVMFRWPVKYDGDVMLTYYLGQYIVPAFIGKVCGKSMLIAIWAQTVWNALGLLIVFCFICQKIKADNIWKKIGVFFIIVFWGGATGFGSKVYQKMGNAATLMAYKWIDFSRVLVHFASNFDALRGAFQHLIVPWICCGMFLMNVKRVEIYVLLALPLFFSSTFGFVYFALLLIGCVVIERVREKNSTVIKRVFSKSNLFLLPQAVIFLIYYAGNVFGDKPQTGGFRIINMLEHWQFYIVFIAVEFMGYVVFLFWYKKKDMLYYLVVVQLLIILFISMGLFNDLCSRGSIPARFILMVWCIEQLYEKKWKYVWNWLIICIMLLAGINAYREMKEVYTLASYGGLGNKDLIMDDFISLNGKAGNIEIRVDEAYNYYTLNYSESLFKRIGRR